MVRHAIADAKKHAKARVSPRVEVSYRSGSVYEM